MTSKGLFRRLLFATVVAPIVWLGAAPAQAIVGGVGVTPAPATTAAPKVVGGTPISGSAYPWVVRLSVGCDGALVAPRVVLTAAHCVPATGATTAITVTGGSPNLSAASAITVRSTYVQRAPSFTAATRGDDWALIQVAKPFSMPVLPLTPSPAYDKGLFRVLGWGATAEGGAQQTVLRTALVPFVADYPCSRAYQGDSFVKSQMICAGNLAHGGVDACQGDSGGPLVRRDATGQYVEVGIVSWGDGCARRGYPGVYTQVSAFQAAITRAVAKLR